MDWKTIDGAIEELSMLKHPFYQAWSCGELTKEDFHSYAAQYYFLENHFPRFLSRVHSNVEKSEIRREILENIIDEERGDDNHQELWLRFAEGLGMTREEVLNADIAPKTQEAIDMLKGLCANENYAVGLAALYAYESQLPKVAETKIKGLKEFYNMDDKRSLEFFEVHKEMDKWHSAVERKLVEQSGATPESVKSAAEMGAKALLTFLDGVESARRERMPEPVAA